jgi:serine/threonine protein kinase
MIHQADIAHLDIKIDNVLVDVVEVDGIFEPCIKIADFGMSQFNLHHINANHGLVYRAPEILDGVRPYDGEKADVFASAHILLAIFALDSFSTHIREEKVRSDAYKYFKENGHLEDYWRAKKLTPSQELQDLFAGMLQEDPDRRWTVEKIINCPWMVNQEVPDPVEVSTEGFRIIELLRDDLSRLSEREPIGVQVGFELYVKGAKGDKNDETD